MSCISFSASSSHSFICLVPNFLNCCERCELHSSEIAQSFRLLFFAFSLFGSCITWRTESSLARPKTANAINNAGFFQASTGPGHMTGIPVAATEPSPRQTFTRTADHSKGKDGVIPSRCTLHGSSRSVDYSKETGPVIEDMDLTPKDLQWCLFLFFLTGVWSEGH